jgi:hypothetical protein
MQEVIDDYQDGLARGSGWAVCGELSDSARAELGRGDEAACFNRAAQVVARQSARGTDWTTSEIVAVDVRGDRALATVRDAGDSRTYLVRLVRERGVWALSATDLDAPSGLAEE